MSFEPRSFLLLHGSQDRRPEGHWHRWLAGELAALGHQVIYPQLPDPDNPDLDTWADRLLGHLAEQRSAAVAERVVIGHSLSVLLWLHAVARCGAEADRVLLVAPPSLDVVAGIEEVKDFGQPAVTAAELAAAAPGGTRLVALWHFECHTCAMVDDSDFQPGDGPSSGISVTLAAGTLQAIREKVGKRGVSAYLERAAQRQIERDNLDELIADFDKVRGQADPEAVAAKRARLTGPADQGGVAA